MRLSELSDELIELVKAAEKLSQKTRLTTAQVLGAGVGLAYLVESDDPQDDAEFAEAMGKLVTAISASRDTWNQHGTFDA